MDVYNFAIRMSYKYGYDKQLLDLSWLIKNIKQIGVIDKSELVKWKNNDDMKPAGSTTHT